MPHPKHEAVRRRYARRCGYCGVSEVEAAGELTVDHYQPATSGGADSDSNLVYACFRCNMYKGAFFPTEEQRARGHYVLHPVLDDATLHLQEDASTGMLEPLTETGRFHIALLRLNRVALVEHRRLGLIARLAKERLAALEDENSLLHETISAQEAYLAQLKLHGDV